MNAHAKEKNRRTLIFCYYYYIINFLLVPIISRLHYMNNTRMFGILIKVSEHVFFHIL